MSECQQRSRSSYKSRSRRRDLRGGSVNRESHKLEPMLVDSTKGFHRTALYNVDNRWFTKHSGEESHDFEPHPFRSSCLVQCSSVDLALTLTCFCLLRVASCLLLDPFHFFPPTGLPPGKKVGFFQHVRAQVQQPLQDLSTKGKFLEHQPRKLALTGDGSSFSPTFPPNSFSPNSEQQRKIVSAPQVLPPAAEDTLAPFFPTTHSVLPTNPIPTHSVLPTNPSPTHSVLPTSSSPTHSVLPTSSSPNQQLENNSEVSLTEKVTVNPAEPSALELLDLLTKTLKLLISQIPTTELTPQGVPTALPSAPIQNPTRPTPPSPLTQTTTDENSKKLNELPTPQPHPTGSTTTPNEPFQSFSGSTHSFSGSLHSFSGSPHSFSGSPHSFSGSPHSFSGSPHSFSVSPQGLNPEDLKPFEPFVEPQDVPLYVDPESMLAPAWSIPNVTLAIQTGDADDETLL
ncbi:unnamed protein product [Cyprideis torosa]|uniref:Uncharacterized protein n=1 Tax=Cyprideis torosa TaxID=163714 RepID=A0A7R8WCN1_9CRUS|nr:unnamed protein product [Cyprideis torosa]CAG0893585.1 unnamed protein product [Cyprideis torosa]